MILLLMIPVQMIFHVSFQTFESPLWRTVDEGLVAFGFVRSADERAANAIHHDHIYFEW